MGMYYMYITLSDEKIARLRRSPELAYLIIRPYDPTHYVDAVRPPRSGLRKFVDAMIDRGPDEVDIPRLTYAEGEGVLSDLHEDWQACHHVLTGTPSDGEPPLNALLGGAPLTGAGIEKWQPRTLTSDQVRAFADALGSLSEADLVARFDPFKMEADNVYPEIWDADSDVDCLLGTFDVLIPSIHDAAAHGYGLLTFFQHSLNRCRLRHEYEERRPHSNA
ncbi:MAG: DUF1877 family protein [Phycisphaera sp.]|nr:DUF1877 family protein [Phycisphaera sp.]